MADIDRIITVNISRQTAVPTMASFNDVMIVAAFLASSTTPVMAAGERVREYGSLAEVAAAGFATDSFVYRAAQKVFSQSPSIQKVKVGRKLTGADGTETWTQALDAINLYDSNWYGLVVESRTLADQQLVAQWVESAARLCVLASADGTILTSGTGSIADYLKTNNLSRTGVFYHPKAGDATDEPSIDAAMFGKVFPGKPGQATWAFKTLAGVAVYTLQTGQITYALGKNANIYTSISDIAVTQMGQTGSGEYFDVMWGVDWLKARIQQKLFTPIVQQDKIPFTDAGISGLVAQLKSALNEAVQNGIIQPDFVVTVPKAADVDAASKKARTLPDLNWTAKLQGAIHKVTINGVVTL